MRRGASDWEKRSEKSLDFLFFNCPKCHSKRILKSECLDIIYK